MASPKALAAIALTLIIAVPICLGYGLASENVPYNEWQTESNVNLSNSILNATTPIFMDYNDVGNNSMVLSGSPVRLIAPTYVETSSTYSSLPIYTTSTGSMTWAGYLQQTYTLTPGLGNTHILELNHPTMPNAYHLSNSGTIFLLPNTGGTLVLETTEGQTVYKTYNGVEYIALVASGSTDTYKVWINAVEQPGLYSAFYTDASSSQSWYVTSNSMYNILQPTERTYSVNIAPIPGYPDPFNEVTIRMVSNGEELWITDNFTEIVRSGGNLIVDGIIYTNVTEATMARAYYSGNTFPYSYPSPSGSYADPAYGWNVGTGAEWLNGFVNNYVRFMIHLEDGDSCSLQPNYDDGGYGSTVTIVKSSGTATVNGEALGDYSYMMVELRPGSTTVTGLQGGWPAMGAQPIRYNAITIDNAVSGNILSVDLTSSEYTAGEFVEFRVDSAGILSGSFPSTYNYTLNMDQLYPSKSYSVKFNSIGIYGDTISVGSWSFAVSNGRISVDGATVPLKGTTVSSKYNGTTYDVYLGGHKLGTSAAPASMTFGGEWSLTVTAQILKQVTGEKAEWSPGNFAFDKDEFVGVIVLIAALAFIGVGMYGARSGIKAGLLLMICGGAALIALTL